MAFGAHEEHWGGRERRVKGPGKAAFSAGVAVEAAPEALGQVIAAVVIVVADLVM
jgi:hypothetical protein